MEMSHQSTHNSAFSLPEDDIKRVITSLTDEIQRAWSKVTKLPQELPVKTVGKRPVDADLTRILSRASRETRQVLQTYILRKKLHRARCGLADVRACNERLSRALEQIRDIPGVEQALRVKHLPRGVSGKPRTSSFADYLHEKEALEEDSLKVQREIKKKFEFRFRQGLNGRVAQLTRQIHAAALHREEREKELARLQARSNNLSLPARSFFGILASASLAKSDGDACDYFDSILDLLNAAIAKCPEKKQSKLYLELLQGLNRLVPPSGDNLKTYKIFQETLQRPEKDST